MSVIDCNMIIVLYCSNELLSYIIMHALKTNKKQQHIYIYIILSYKQMATHATCVYNTNII